MPISPQQITFNLSNLPAVAQTFITNLDAALQSGWNINQKVRQLTFQWATYGGFTQQKLGFIQDVLKEYKELGWVQVTLARNSSLTNANQFTIVFER